MFQIRVGSQVDIVVCRYVYPSMYCAAFGSNFAPTTRGHMPAKVAIRKKQIVISHVLKKPSSAPSEQHRQLRSHKSASAFGKVRRRLQWKTPASDIGEQPCNLISKKPASAFDEHSRWQGTRVSVHKYRITVRRDIREEVMQALKDLRATQHEWEDDGWFSAAGEVVSAFKCLNMGHGGHKNKKKDVLDPVPDESVEIKKEPAFGGDDCEVSSVVGCFGSPTPVPTPPPTSRTRTVCQMDNVGVDPGLPAVLPPVSMSRKHPRLAGYSIIEHIGGGSFGAVYKATWKDPQKSPEMLAVKLLRKSGKHVKATEETMREISILKELEHYNIVRLVAWRETHFNMQLIFPYYEQDLRKFHNNVGVSKQHAMVFTHGLLSAAQTLRSKHILHRDIKPQNILVQSQPLAAKLADFGGARHVLPDHGPVGDLPGLSVDVCTIWYRAPEIFLPPHRYHFPSDIWSVGVTLVELEVGRCPFRSRHEIGMLFSMFNVLGTPEPDEWNNVGMQRAGLLGEMGVSILPNFSKLKQKPWGSAFGDEFQELVTALLQFVPENRLTPQQALSSRFGQQSSRANRT